MDEEEQFSDCSIAEVVNEVIEDSSVDDEKVEDTTEAMFKVLSRQIQAKTAAGHYNLELDVLEKLVGAAKRRLHQKSADEASNAKKSAKKGGQGDNKRQSKGGEGSVDNTKAKKKMKAATTTNNNVAMNGLEAEQAEEEEEGENVENTPTEKARKSEEENKDSNTKQKKKRKLSEALSAPKKRKRSSTAAANNKRSLTSNNNNSNIVEASKSPSIGDNKRQPSVMRQQPMRSAKDFAVASQINNEKDSPNNSQQGQRKRSAASASSSSVGGAEKVANGKETTAKKKDNDDDYDEAAMAPKQRRKRRSTFELMALKKGGAAASSSSNSNSSATITPSNTSSSELDSLNMALALYKGNSMSDHHQQQHQQYSLAQQRTRRSNASTNLAVALIAAPPMPPANTPKMKTTTPKPKALTWSEMPPAATASATPMDSSRSQSRSQSQKQQPTPARVAAPKKKKTPQAPLISSGTPNLLDDSTVNQSSQSTKAAKNIIRNNPRWRHFPQIVVDVVDEVLSRMNSRSEAEQEKCAKMRAAVWDIIMLGHTVKLAHDNHGVCESTLRKYAHFAKANLDIYLLADDNFLGQFDGETTTLDQLRTAMNQLNTSSSADGIIKQSPTAIPATHPFPAAKVVRSRKSEGGSGTEQRRSSSTNNKANIKRTSMTTPMAAYSGSNKQSTQSSHSSAGPENVCPPPPSQQSSSQELVPHLLSQHQAPHLLTCPQVDRISFAGTKEEFRVLATEQIKRFFAGDTQQLSMLSNLMTNYVYSEYLLQRQMDRCEIPYNMLRATYMLLARYIKMDQLNFTDVDDDDEDD